MTKLEHLKKGVSRNQSQEEILIRREIKSALKGLKVKGFLDTHMSFQLLKTIIERQQLSRHKYSHIYQFHATRIYSLPLTQLS